MQRKFDFRVRDLHCAAGLPIPIFALGSKGLGQGFAVDQYFEATRLAFGFPTSHPILGSHVDVVRSGFGKGDFGGGVFDCTTEPMSQHVGRTHLVDELRVELPTAVIGKTLCFHQNGLGTSDFVRRGKHLNRNQQTNNGTDHGNFPETTSFRSIVNGLWLNPTPLVRLLPKALSSFACERKTG